MIPALRPLLIRFEADPSLAGALVHALRDPTEWLAPHGADGDVATVTRNGLRFLPIAVRAEDMPGAPDLRPLAADLVWAMVIAGQVDGVVLDVHGPAPGWVDKGGVLRIAGVPGLSTVGKLTARSVTEAHLVMDLLGWPPGARNHRLVVVDGDMLAQYEYPEATPPMPSILRFDVPDPGPGGANFGGPEPSTLLDPVAWRIAADRYAQGVPAVDATVSPAKATAYARRLALAAACLDEANRFADGEKMPQTAFVGPLSGLVADLAPVRIDPRAMAGIAAAWRRMASAFDPATAS